MRLVNVYNAAKNAMRGAVGGYNMWTGVGTPPMCFINHAMSEYQAMVMAALAEGLIRGDPFGRVPRLPAWEVTFSSLKGATLDEDQWAFRAVIDKESGLMVALDGRAAREQPGGSGDVTDFEMRVTGWVVDAPIPSGAFDVAMPARGYDGRCALAEIEGRASIRPFVPAEVPQGYELMHAATDPLKVYSHPEFDDEPVGVAASFGDGEPAYDNSRPPGDFPRDNEVGLLYARGLDHFWVQIAPLTGPWRLDAQAFVDNVAWFGRDVRTGSASKAAPSPGAWRRRGSTPRASTCSSPTTRTPCASPATSRGRRRWRWRTRSGCSESRREGVGAGAAGAHAPTAPAPRHAGVSRRPGASQPRPRSPHLLPCRLRTGRAWWVSRICAPLPSPARRSCSTPAPPTPRGRAGR